MSLHNNNIVKVIINYKGNLVSQWCIFLSNGYGIENTKEVLVSPELQRSQWLGCQCVIRDSEGT